MVRGTIHIVIPCYNPPPEWQPLLANRISALRAALPALRLPVVVVNDGSSSGLRQEERDGLLRAVQDVRWLHHERNRGKGAALRTGVEAAQGACVITDIDMPYTVESIAAVCQALANGADVVLGHRSIAYYSQVPWARRVISRTFRWVLRRVLRFPISDTQCGLKGFGDRGRALFLATTIDRFLFDMEFVMLLSRRRELRVELVDARLNAGVRFSRMNYRILLRESLNFLRVSLRMLARS